MPVTTFRLRCFVAAGFVGLNDLEEQLRALPIFAQRRSR